jgi:hypothetical protein
MYMTKRTRHLTGAINFSGGGDYQTTMTETGLGEVLDFKSHSRGTDKMDPDVGVIDGLQADSSWTAIMSPIESESSLADSDLITERSLALLFYHDPQALIDIAYGTDMAIVPPVRLEP